MALTSRIPAIVLVSEQKAKLAVQRALARIDKGSKQRSRVDTGAMRAGWESEQTGPLEGIVVNRISYTVFNEYGTSRTPAQPMLRPAIEETQPLFEKEMRDAWL